MTTLTLLHTSPVVIKPINDLARALMPRVAIINLLDDGISARSRERPTSPRFGDVSSGSPSARRTRRRTRC